MLIAVAICCAHSVVVSFARSCRYLPPDVTALQLTGELTTDASARVNLTSALDNGVYARPVFVPGRSFGYGLFVPFLVQRLNVALIYRTPGSIQVGVGSAITGLSTGSLDTVSACLASGLSAACPHTFSVALVVGAQNVWINSTADGTYLLTVTRLPADLTSVSFLTQSAQTGLASPVSGASLVPTITSNVFSYSLAVPFGQNALAVIPTYANSSALPLYPFVLASADMGVRCSGAGLASGATSSFFPLALGQNELHVCMPHDGNYTIIVTSAHTQTRARAQSTALRILPHLLAVAGVSFLSVAPCPM